MNEKNEGYEEEAEIILVDGWEHIHCPVCGKLVAIYDICANCYWQNTGETNIEGGPNRITLAEAKKQYRETGKIKNFELLRK